MKKIILICSVAILLFACKNKADEAAALQQSKQATIDSMNIVMAKQKAEIAKQKSIDSMQAIVAIHEKNKQAAETANTETAKKKKGWSSTAKGAVIGAGVGAVSGAVIDKKHGEGAIVGGLAGAALGAGTGAIIDDSKKNKKKK